MIQNFKDILDPNDKRIKQFFCLLLDTESLFLKTKEKQTKKEKKSNKNKIKITKRT